MQIQVIIGVVAIEKCNYSRYNYTHLREMIIFVVTVSANYGEYRERETLIKLKDAEL